MIFKGSGTALCTPFTDTGVNFDTLEKLINFQLENETDALIICGTTGEPATMSDDEKKSVISFSTKKINGRIPVIAGVGGNNTAQVIQFAKFAEDIGVDAVLAVTPYYNKCTASGLIKHFETLANSINIPIILYNVPSRTGVNMSATIFADICTHKNIAAVKEASANISQICEYARLSKGNAEIYSGNDDHVVPVLSMGGIGVISVVSNILPKYMHDMVHYYLNGNVDIARDMQLKILPLAHALFTEVNPIPIKTALRLMGYDMGPLRMPLSEMESVNLDELISNLKDFKLLE